MGKRPKPDKFAKYRELYNDPIKEPFNLRCSVDGGETTIHVFQNISGPVGDFFPKLMSFLRYSRLLKAVSEEEVTWIDSFIEYLDRISSASDFMNLLKGFERDQRNRFGKIRIFIEKVDDQQ